jgi:predicted negative regulator of RcsB-dependent stress response
MQQNCERWWEAEIQRLRGELLFKQKDSNPAEAQASIEQAIDVACAERERNLCN